MVEIESGNLTFEHCILRYSLGDAIRIDPPSLQKAGYHPETPEAQVLHVNLSKFNGNGGYAINNQDPALVVKAAYNWWGSASGPAAADNPGGAGNGITGQVSYRPYLHSPDSRLTFIPLIWK
jgi:hypothetical protein